MTVILILSFISSIIFFFTHKRKIDDFIKSILTYKLNNMSKPIKPKLNINAKKMKNNNKNTKNNKNNKNNKIIKIIIKTIVK